ncbi:MAG: enamine deaminase RidA (YjgF/YER057c/UK114 family), partial [Rickettsiales bacterium]
MPINQQLENCPNKQLEKLRITLPKPIVPVANYMPFTISGNQIFISGQLPIENGEVKFVGKLGEKISIEDGQKAARICAINILSNLNSALEGNLGKVARCVKLGIFVNSTSDFTDQPAVANGASDLMVEVFGENG